MLRNVTRTSPPPTGDFVETPIVTWGRDHSSIDTHVQPQDGQMLQQSRYRRAWLEP